MKKTFNHHAKIVSALLASAFVFASCTKNDDGRDPVPVEYTVTYHANGGDGSAYTQTVTEGDSATVTGAPDAGISRLKYLFVSWNTAEDGSGTTYNAGETIAPTADMNLYAVWKYGYVRISYSGAGESETNFMTDEIEVDSQHEVLEVEDTGLYNMYTGYGFAGEWATEDGTIYKPGDMITADRDITLYAKWKITEYRVVYYADEVGGGIVDVFSAEEPIILRSSAEEAGIVRPPRPPDSYSSYRWREYDSGGGYREYAMGAEYTPDGTTTVIMMRIMWIVSFEWVKYITFYFQESTGDGAQSYTVICKDGDTFTAPTLEEAGFTSSRKFEGWNARPNGTTYQPGDQIPSSRVSELYAVWGGVTIAPPPGSDDEPIVVTITTPVVYDDAKGNVIWRDNFVDGTTHKILHLDNDLNGKKDREIFLGWATSPDSDEVVYAAKGRMASRQTMEPSTLTVTLNQGVHLYPVTRTGRIIRMFWREPNNGDSGMFAIDYYGDDLYEGTRNVRLARPASDYYYWILDNWYGDAPATFDEKRYQSTLNTWVEAPILPLSDDLRSTWISLELYDRYPMKK